MLRTASAPGKVVIAGEYAVLDGAPAVVMAVDRRASAGLRAPGVPGNEPVAGLLGAVCAALDVDAPVDGVSLDTAAFYAADTGGRRGKLGLGSSAALTAALCRLLLPDESSRATLLRFALAAHRRFQSGHGSGVDVAASVAGGLLTFRMPAAGIEPVGWPDGVSYAVWWSGVPASTRASLEQLSRSGESSPRRALADAAGTVADAWSTGRSGAVLPALATYVDALAEFDARHRLRIFAAGHGDLVGAARQLGVVYKPCGAGGGDIGIALAEDSAALDAFAAKATAKGFRRLELSIDTEGARLNGGAS